MRGHGTDTTAPPDWMHVEDDGDDPSFYSDARSPRLKSKHVHMNREMCLMAIALVQNLRLKSKNVHMNREMCLMAIALVQNPRLKNKNVHMNREMCLMAIALVPKTHV